MDSTPHENAKRIVMVMLRDIETATTDVIRSKVRLVSGMLRADDPTTAIDEDQLAREVESAWNVWVPGSITIEDERGHIEWLAAKRADLDWRFWRRYRQYLEETQDWAPQTIRRLHEISEDILGKLEDPGREGSWDRRGMLVGHVQSGKTSNYIGLICKAADAGYKLIIVLAGLNDNLRSQTQLRLDEGFLGWDTQKRMLFDQQNVRIGVGALRGSGFFHVNSLTSSAQKGDFSKRIADQAGIPPGGHDPVLLVVKKNRSILENVIKWATEVQGEIDPESGLRRVFSVPLLVIDDEADQASVNTRDVFDSAGNFDKDRDPTAINRAIRTLLHSFQQSAYLGYTATPFANIFIYKDGVSDKYGEDLFPRSFITSLPKPSNYIGPSKVFGLAEDTAAGLEEEEGLPVVHAVSDYSTWIPDGHKNGYVPGPLPESVRQAIKRFILVCAARQARAQGNTHNSMLIHVTRFNSVQAEVAEQVREELSYLVERLHTGDGDSPYQLLDELRELWVSDFIPTTEGFADPDLPVTPWSMVEPNLYKAAAKIRVREINGLAKDALEYYEHRQSGLSVIAIGGDKLSRGLTLEGLSVSYYLRASQMYDTLMQMGRWFGYRPGYSDLCRLYTTESLIRWYKDITAADEELDGLFREMAAVGATPEQFGLRVRMSPDGLLITARVKMRNGIELPLSFSGSISETIAFDRDQETIKRNFAVTDTFIRDTDARHRQRVDRGNFLWSGVSGSEVADFLSRFKTHSDARKAQAGILENYIRSRLADSPAELSLWTAVLISNVKAKSPYELGGLTVGLTERARYPDTAETPPLSVTYSIRRLVSPIDEALDLSAHEFDRALAKTRADWELDRGRYKRDAPPRIPSGRAIRSERASTKGLILIYPLDPEKAELTGPPLIGIAISFPTSAKVKPIMYKVNNIYWEQELTVL